MASARHLDPAASNHIAVPSKNYTFKDYKHLQFFHISQSFKILVVLKMFLIQNTNFLPFGLCRLDGRGLSLRPAMAMYL